MEHKKLRGVADLGPPTLFKPYEEHSPPDAPGMDKWVRGPIILSSDGDDGFEPEGELVAKGVDVHIEQMNKKNWWVGIYAGSHTIHVNFYHGKNGIKAYWRDESDEVADEVAETLKLEGKNEKEE